MIIEFEGDDHIIYSNATREDFERAVHDAQFLKSFGTYLERIETKDHLELYWVSKDEFGTHSALMVKLNKIEQELTIWL